MSAWDFRASYAKTFIVTLFLNALTLFLDTAMWALSGNPALRTANLIARTSGRNQNEIEPKLCQLC
jgi:hypothetical protein